LVLISVLLGVIIGIRIQDHGDIFQQKEKQSQTSDLKVNSNQEVEKKEQQTADDGADVAIIQGQTETEVESTEVFLETNSEKKSLPQTKRSLLSKMGKNLDKGVTFVFSNLTDRFE
jgi:predicted N-acyltransferase